MVVDGGEYGVTAGMKHYTPVFYLGRAMYGVDMVASCYLEHGKRYRTG